MCHGYMQTGLLQSFFKYPPCMASSPAAFYIYEAMAHSVKIIRPNAQRDMATPDQIHVNTFPRAESELECSPFNE